MKVINVSYLRIGGRVKNPCAPRKRFATKDHAMAASKVIADRQNLLRLPEPCSKCNGWHLAGKYPLSEVKV
jgi:hypothetical protein